MTDTQLYLAIGIPSALFMLNFLAVLATGFWQAKRFDDMRDLMMSQIGRVEGVLGSQIGRVEGVLGSEIVRVEGVLGAKIDTVSVRVKALEDEIHSPLVKHR